MGNNQGGLHKRERASDGQQRSRQWTAGSIAGGTIASGHIMSGVTTEDGCPVQVCISLIHHLFLEIVRSTII